MRNHSRASRSVSSRSVLVSVMLLCGLCAPALSQSTIDPLAENRLYGWSENAGFLNLAGNGPQGVRVQSDGSLNGLSGYAWHENCGWIHFGDGTPDSPPHYSNTSASDYGVNLDPATGNLSGYAWGENIGWIAFDTTGSGGSRVQISKFTGDFSGLAWAENIGWLTFDGLGASVARTDPATVPVSLSQFGVE
jgi:hypothetical protein